jgi:enamine deaminase RidA (YjgF/YER057c/UK114 family)
MTSIQHFAPPAGINAPPLSFATRTGDLLFVSGIPGFDENGDNVINKATLKKSLKSCRPVLKT